MPQHLDVTGDAHLAVGEAINKYGVALSDATTQMGALTLKASGDHANVQAAVLRYNTAEAVLAAATVKATAAKTAAVATAVTPAGPAFAATAAVAETELAAAKAEETAAMAHYQAMLGIWNDDLRQAGSIKTQLGVDVDAQVATIDAQARKRFEENPEGLAAVWQEIDSFFDRNADLLSNISDILQIVGSIMMFIPGLQVLGAVLLAIGVGLKGLLALTGNASWGEFAFDLLTSLPGGAIFKALKAGKLGPQVAKLANGAGKFGDMSLSAAKSIAGKTALKTADGLKAVGGEKFAKSAYAKMTRGGEICFAAEPVDMATGALVDFHTDVHISGVLPLVVDRNSNSSHRLGRALGAQWVSRMDCRIEVCADEVLMLNPDKHRWDFTYNLDGQVTEEADYNNLITRFEQNPIERWVKKIDPAGGVTTTWFDPVGKIIHHTDSNNNDTIYSYNHWGYLEEIANQHTALTYTYDQYGRIIAETTTLASGETSRVELLRDPVGRTKQITTNTHGLVHHHTYSFDQHTGEIVTIGAYNHNLEELAAIGLGSDQAGRRNRISTGALARTLTFDTCSRPTYDVTYNLDAIPTGENGASTSGNNTGAANTTSRANNTGLPVGLVAGRHWSWRADNTITTINDALAGQATFDVDLLGRVTTVTRTPTQHTTAGAGSGVGAPTASVGAGLGANNTAGGGLSAGGGLPVVENYGVSVAGVITTMDAPDYEAQRQEAALGLARSPREHTKKPSAVMLQVEHKGTLVTRVGKTSYTYDKNGRIIESVTRRLSRKALVKRFTYHGSTGQLATFTSSDAPNLVWEYTYDGLDRRVAKTCRNTTTGDILTRTIFTHVGDQLTAEHHLTSSAGDDVVGRVWITDPATGDIIGQINHTTNHAAGAGDPATWSQAKVDATFYAMVADLAGAPQELINPHTGAIAGKATHTLFGRRKWDGETTPLLFAGQYEDQETGLVYNRYRYYNPHSGTYTSQDPLGVGPNPATAQGYVHNPLTWIDLLGLQAHPKLPDPGSMSPMEVAREGFHRQGFQSGDPMPHGFREKWIRDGYRFEVRIHGPNTEAPPNAPARNEDVLRIARKELLTDPNPKAQGKGTFQGGADGVWYKESFLKTASDGDRIGDPAADAAAIQVHIPAAGMVVP